MNMFAVKLELIIFGRAWFQQHHTWRPGNVKGATICYYVNYWNIDHFNIEVWSFDALLATMVINLICIPSLAQHSIYTTIVFMTLNLTSKLSYPVTAVTSKLNHKLLQRSRIKRVSKVSISSISDQGFHDKSKVCYLISWASSLYIHIGI